jgi:uncharacterized protein
MATLPLMNSSKARPKSASAAPTKSPTKTQARPRPSPSASVVQASPVAEWEALERALAQVPEPLEPLDVAMIDGFLCGVLVQPEPVHPRQWLPFVADTQGRALPKSFDPAPLYASAQARCAQWDAAIARREWLDPWIFADDAGDQSPAEAVMPWVLGFAHAQSVFPDLMDDESPELNEALALIFQHLDPQELEDAEGLLEAIEAIEPPVDLSDAVERLVRAVLLLADITRPLNA